ncbi:MAG: ABC transporter permease [Pseudonocardia sp.]
MSLAADERAGPAAPRRHPVLMFLVRRIGAAVATLFVASVLIFAATQLLPGDAASAAMGKAANPAAVAELRHRLGLDQSVFAQYGDWLWSFVRGDLGDSAVALAGGATSAPVSEVIAEPLANSAILAVVTIVLTVPLTLGLGVLTGLRVGAITDHVLSTVSLALVALPEFVLAALLILLFFNGFDLLPPVALVASGESPLSRPAALVLPILTLLIIGVAVGMRQVRAGVAEVKERQYVTTARLNGVPERRVVRHYIVRNSVATSVQMLAQHIQYLLGGIILVEVVFAYPGIGKLLVSAVTARDFTEVQAITMIIGACYVALNILADLAVVFLVPKLRTTELA